MTAEIAILNKSAVALAADSKVTISLGGRQKTYDTVDKIFSLSKTAPVGAMIYGNAEFMQFPWETILKEYRRQKPHKTFGTIFDWAADLEKFLVNFFPFKEVDDLALVGRIAESVIEQLYQDYIENPDAGLDLAEVGEAIGSAVAANIADAEQQDDYFDAAEWKKIKPRVAAATKGVLADSWIESFSEHIPAVRQLIELIVRKDIVSSVHSGLVLTGFGEDELLPSLQALEIEGVFAGRLKRRVRKHLDVTRQSMGAIIPFAQSDMVYRFMEGIDPGYSVLMRDSIEELLVRNAADVAKSLGHSTEDVDKILPAVMAATKASVDQFWHADVLERQTRFALPIIDMAMRLPKDELAHLAEALVSLTSLQRRVSRELETVGGAIDVAVISKGDGLVWIKRKHYFNPDRNIRFVSGYFSDHGQTGEEDGHG